MLGRIMKVALSCCLAVGASTIASACDQDDADGADIALVLSGGGALTSTQIGALQVIEEIGVPIHCVFGTSMGSVTGAMYVSGYTSNEIAEIYLTRDWSQLFRGQIGRVDKPFLQKEGTDEYFADYFAGIGPDGVKLPGGLASMGGLQAEYRNIFSHIPNDTDFDQELRVPFRSVAMNLSTGEAVAFKNGDLVQTILASMAVPGAFAPRKINEELYIDGGMASQLPVRFAKEMGADIVIAIDTTLEPSKLEGSPSLISTTSQIIQITVHRNRQRDVALLTEEDLLMTPDLTGLSSSNFNVFDKGLEAGRSEAETFRERLQEIASKAAPVRDKAINTSSDRPVASTLQLSNASQISDAVIIERLSLDRDDLTDRGGLDRRLRSLSSFGAFGEVDLSQSIDGPLLRVEPRSLGQNLLQAGFRASTTFDGDARYSILSRISRRPVGRFGGEASLSLELGTDFGATAQYYQPFGPEGRYFAIPVISYRGEQVLLDIADERLGEFFEQRGDARLRVGREFGDWGVLSVE